MNLSTATLTHVQGLIGKKIRDVNSQFSGSPPGWAELPPGGAQVKAKVRYQVKRLTEIGEAIAECYEEGFKLERKLIAKRDIDEIAEKIKDSVVRGFDGLLEIDKEVGIMQSQIESHKISIPAVIHQELILKMQRAELEQKYGPVVEVAPAKAKVAVPDLAFIADKRIRAIVERDYVELQSLDPEKHTKSALVLSGGIIEGLLLDALVVAGRYKFEDGVFLKDMIGPALSKGIIREDRLTDAVRKYRNLIHPWREISNDVTFSKADANIAKHAVDVVIRDIQEWTAKSKAQPDIGDGMPIASPAE